MAVVGWQQVAVIVFFALNAVAMVKVVVGAALHRNDAESYFAPGGWNRRARNFLLIEFAVLVVASALID